ncbi:MULTISPECIES: membrane protein [Bradyrhizobium]|jgi:hypothetical protein|uniref:membrane protein n=1 Tax=Bradyrhizobium TaxID=374 RepID=UPI0004134C46|nr:MULTISPECIES: membrane protein [Bradyrhizobium]AUC97625.1 hypothetical protein CWS35_27785 [Bradyrhizobium sp. SK17]KIU43180.1 membrane protein [Bradyrhizobium elkanii]MBK5650396.1 hypothetical protein [Rhizobium sp.]OCX30127.1 hypothetical protein QU42_16665 [Bradyrhizobium sp. UASWS1016]
MDRSRLAAALLGAALLFAAATDYIPAFIDTEGRVFGLFHLDIYKDALHLASAAWAIAAAAISRQASIFFLKVFGTLYFLDGVMGVFTGSGYLDLSIFIDGVRSTSTFVKVASSVPHLALGAFGIVTGFSARSRLA